MKGEVNLPKLLCAMAPVLQVGEFVFVTLEEADFNYQRLKPLGTFIEKEGVSIITEKATADEQQLDYSGTFKCITLSIHSSLEAVGLTATVSSALAKAEISANVVAAFYHDHIFVPSEKAELALQVLKNLSNK